MGATGGYFWNISKRTYIFEILIFKKYKNEKPPKNGWAIDEPKGGKRKAQGDHVFT